MANELKLDCFSCGKRSSKVILRTATDEVWSISNMEKQAKNKMAKVKSIQRDVSLNSSRKNKERKEIACFSCGCFIHDFK